VLRRVIDPSLVEVASLPDNHKELVQAIAHHSFLVFDNVSYISENTSDTLCKAITGSGFVKRELYTDDDDIIYNFKRSIGINGINLVATKPDLLDRALILELERIDESKRRQESEITESLERDVPVILSGVFDTLVKTLNIKPTIKLDNLPRMADFALWGSAIAEALGYKKEEFLEAYKHNMEKQVDAILNENMIAMTIIHLMEERAWQKWEGTASELLHSLTKLADFNGVNVRDKYWPKAPNSLSRSLNILNVTLRSVDIMVKISGGKKRSVTIEKISKTIIQKNTETAEVDLPSVTTKWLPDDGNDDKTLNGKGLY
jgi:hypothetical protein